MLNSGKINSNTLFMSLFAITLLLVIGSSFYKYYYLKNYDYIIEASCNPELENCFFRDCENNEDECLPNNYSYYKQFFIKASDFPKCSDNSCAEQCASNTIQCIIIECDDTVDTCTTPPVQTIEEDLEFSSSTEIEA